LGASGIAVHALGVGARKGSPIPVPGGAAKELKHDAAGRVVLTPRQEEGLAALPVATGGLYQRAATAGYDPKPIEQRIAPELVSDYLVHRFAIAGTPEECAARVRALAAAGVKRLLLTPPERIYLEVVNAWGREVIPKL